MLDFFTSTYPKARKEYKCDLCGQKIEKGEKYHRYSGKYDGDLFDDKYHLICQKIINAYCEASTEGEYTNDEIYDWLRDDYCPDCAMYANDECEDYPLSCPYIRKKFESSGKE